MPHLRRSFLLAAALSASLPPLSAVPGLEVRPAATPPKIDGVLDDAAWPQAAHSDAFRQVLPREDATPSEHTEFWAAYDRDFLYVAVRCTDREPEKIRAVNMQRDQDNGSDDLVRIVIDTFHRQSDGYFFVLTAAGGKHDGLIQNKSEDKLEWDGLWFGKVSRSADGWAAEFALPLKSLAFDPANETWGFNIERVIRRRRETVRWAGISRARGVASLPDAGELRGLRGLQQGRGVDFKPFASVTRHSNPLPDQKEIEFRPGFDLVWHVTPSLAATLTINTNFADAEADDRQVNLTRFPLFYPEKRSFFTQDASLFTFGGIRADPLPFFSRRLGLALDGTPIDLLGGVKVTGRLGRVTLGLLDVQTDRQGGVDSKNLLVGRATVQVLEESNVGVIFTHGDPRVNGDNTLLGFDFNYANTRLAGQRTIEAHAWVQFTDSDFTGGRGAAAAVAVNYPNEPLAFTYYLGRYSTLYDPALGSVQRTNMDSFFLITRYRWRPDRLGLRRIDVTEFSDLTTSQHLRPLNARHQVPLVEFEANSGDLFHLIWELHHDRLEAPFAIQPAVLIPAGNHHWSLFQADWTSSPSRPASVGLAWTTGGFYTGHRTDYGTSFAWRPSRRLELTGKFNLQEIRLPEGHFDVRLASAGGTYFFNPELQLRLLAQYDNFSESLGVNFRLKWTLSPGNDFFFVVNQGYDAAGDHLRPVRNDTSLKGGLTFRY